MHDAVPPPCPKRVERVDQDCAPKPAPVPAPIHCPPRKPESAGHFLQNLLPKGFDTSDLIIVLLLLLMAGDNADEQSNAILTLLLYFYM